MSLFKKKEEVKDEAKIIEEKAYEEERIKQAKEIGIARAKAEAKERIKAPTEPEGSKFGKACGKIVTFMQSDKVQGFADNVSNSFDTSMAGPKEAKPKKKKKEKKGKEAGNFDFFILFIVVSIIFTVVVL